MVPLNDPLKKAIAEKVKEAGSIRKFVEQHPGLDLNAVARAMKGRTQSIRQATYDRLCEAIGPERMQLMTDETHENIQALDRILALLKTLPENDLTLLNAMLNHFSCLSDKSKTDLLVDIAKMHAREHSGGSNEKTSG